MFACDGENKFQFPRIANVFGLVTCTYAFRFAVSAYCGKAGLADGVNCSIPVVAVHERGRCVWHCFPLGGGNRLPKFDLGIGYLSDVNQKKRPPKRAAQSKVNFDAEFLTRPSRAGLMLGYARMNEREIRESVRWLGEVI